ncbi:tetratricopeptide repeat protein [Croceicoccus sediminis]|uniref:tetratricopeptide repeat protein n=1 Tax=Croceicoccus sediminis TaxID=2571150 RepID=UPI00118360FE|nr:tetratricopeptide repeat protein [Croceicoccus sediminis]
MGLNIDEQKAVERFRDNIVEPSKTKLVILDFWAEWCGPCKALTPILEKVAADYADKGVILAKVNVDEEQFIASQFQVRSIPTVYAMFQGQPVADLTQARTESQLKQVLDQLLSQLPVEAGAPGEDAAQDVAPLLAMGEEVLSGGDAERALGIFAQIVQMAPDNVEAQAGLLRAMIEAGHVEDAETAIASLPEDVRKDLAIERAVAALELAKNKPDDSELENLRKAAAERPADMDAQMAFAEAAFAAGSRDEAAETLLSMVRTEPEWQDGAAKAKLLQIFEAVGLEDPWVGAQRRKLSLILFG